MTASVGERIADISVDQVAIARLEELSRLTSQESEAGVGTANMVQSFEAFEKWK